MNSGKRFEDDFRKSFDELEGKVSIDRFYVPRGQKGIFAISDFVIYQFPTQYYVECKSHKESSIPFSVVTNNQWNGLLEKSNIRGVLAGVLYEFSDHEEVWWVDICYLEGLKRLGDVSITLEQARRLGVRLHGVKPRSRWRFYVEDFLRRVRDGGRWMV